MASQTIAQISMALRELFKDKSELCGVDDWDTLIGILMALKEVANAVEEMEAQLKEETEE